MRMRFGSLLLLGVLFLPALGCNSEEGAPVTKEESVRTMEEDMKRMQGMVPKRPEQREAPAEAPAQ